MAMKYHLHVIAKKPSSDINVNTVSLFIYSFIIFWLDFKIYFCRETPLSQLSSVAIIYYLLLTKYSVP